MLNPTAITALLALFSGAFGAYWTVRTFYLKRADEARDRQLAALAAQQAEIDRQKEQYAEGKRKEYAAERDFGHLMRQYETLSLNISSLHDYHEKQIADIEGDLREIKSMLNILLIQAGATETGIARYLKRDDS